MMLYRTGTRHFLLICRFGVFDAVGYLFWHRRFVQDLEFAGVAVGDNSRPCLFRDRFFLSGFDVLYFHFFRCLRGFAGGGATAGDCSMCCCTSLGGSSSRCQPKVLLPSNSHVFSVHSSRCPVSGLITLIFSIVEYFIVVHGEFQHSIILG